MLDADCLPTSAKRREANRNGIEFITLEPCLEGFLLKVLGQPVPRSSQACKDHLKRIDRREPFEAGFYADNFPKALLDVARLTVPELNTLLALFDT